MSKFKGTVTKNDVSRIIKNSDSDRDSRISKTGKKNFLINSKKISIHLKFYYFLEFVNMILSHTKS